MRHLMAQRGLRFAKKAEHPLVPLAKLLCPGHRSRLRAYKRRLANEEGENFAIVDAGQNLKMRSQMFSSVPTLLRNSIMVALKKTDNGVKELLLLPSAHFDVMGIPVHPSQR